MAFYKCNSKWTASSIRTIATCSGCKWDNCCKWTRFPLHRKMAQNSSTASHPTGRVRAPSRIPSWSLSPVTLDCFLNVRAVAFRQSKSTSSTRQPIFVAFRLPSIAPAPAWPSSSFSRTAFSCAVSDLGTRLPPGWRCRTRFWDAFALARNIPRTWRRPARERKLHPLLAWSVSRCEKEKNIIRWQWTFVLLWMLTNTRGIWRKTSKAQQTGNKRSMCCERLLKTSRSPSYTECKLVNIRLDVAKFSFALRHLSRRCSRL